MTQALQPSATAPAASSIQDASSIQVASTFVDGRQVRYSTGGSGPTVVLLHGWGLGHHAYRPGLRQLVQRGFRVVAPALPGFGGTAELPVEERNFAGYAAWVVRFARALRIRQAVFVGHSFGGGVAMQTAASEVGLARSLVLLNSVGAPWRATKRGEQAMAKRPIWSWGLNIPRDVVSLLGSGATAMPSVLEDLVPNVIRNPFGVARISKIARHADLLDILESVRNRGIPVSIIHSVDDGVIPRSSFDFLCTAARVEGLVVDGNHSWPMTSPELFADVVAKAARRCSTRKSVA